MGILRGGFWLDQLMWEAETLSLGWLESQIKLLHSLNYYTGLKGSVSEQTHVLIPVDLLFCFVVVVIDILEKSLLLLQKCRQVFMSE